MPTLTLSAEDAEKAIRYLARVADSDYPFPSMPEITAMREQKLEGETLLELSNCQTCHQVGDREYKPSTKQFYTEEQMEEIVKLAPDLGFAPERVRTDWARRWISNPQAILPDTKMPDLKLLDRDRDKIMQFIFTDHLDQAEWREWGEKMKEKEAEQSEEFNEFG